MAGRCVPFSLLVSQGETPRLTEVLPPSFVYDGETGHAALFLLMSYMHGQRRKHLGSPRTLAPSAGKSSTATTTTPEKRARHDITSRVSETNVLEDTAAQTPARSTRSHTRKSQ